ncbi:MAG: nucleotidyl transferase AbiEii/AbiGii toxin family protein [Desulfobulbaceae bacterium]|jgi:hypothetical protein|nr:nucleotidyl transferase AbiEii/AbiGii toxin family protein [Desulfobulbaceae bacterium]
MGSDPFLHELSDFDQLIEIVSDELGITSQLVEKDYWIMHCLYSLTRQGFSFQLKGGTSLSKGYKIIERFSEDIDIQIDPPPGMEVKCGKNHDKPAHIESRRQYYDWLANKIEIAGSESVERDHQFDNERFRSAGIRINYPSRLDALPGLKRGILLEVGFDDITPNKPVDISSWAYDRAREKDVKIAENLAFGIACYHPGYTFVEKLQTVSTKFRLQQESGEFHANFLRHYYDIYCLLGDADVQDFIGSKEYNEHKKRRFRQKDVSRIAENEAFLFSDAEVLKQYQAEYEKTSGLYYKGMIPFESILERIRQYIDIL